MEKKPGPEGEIIKQCLGVRGVFRLYTFEQSGGRKVKRVRDREGGSVKILGGRFTEEARKPHQLEARKFSWKLPKLCSNRPT